MTKLGLNECVIVRNFHRTIFNVTHKLCEMSAFNQGICWNTDISALAFSINEMLELSVHGLCDGNSYLIVYLSQILALLSFVNVNNQISRMSQFLFQWKMGN